MDINEKIEKWEAHFFENPTDVISVLAVVAATHPALEISDVEETDGKESSES